MNGSTFPAHAAMAASPNPGRLTVDAVTRVFHWLLALSFVGAYATADAERWRALHVTLGYTMAGLIVFRVVWGLVGPRHARLSALWRRLQGIGPWITGLRAGVPGVRHAQILLLALGVACLLALTGPVALSGWITWNEWTGEWMEEVHEVLGNTLLVVVLVHVGLIALLTAQRGRGQVMPMLTGRAPGKGPDLIKSQNGLVAALLLAAVLAFWVWQWRESPSGLVPLGSRATASGPSSGAAARGPGGTRRAGKRQSHDDED